MGHTNLKACFALFLPAFVNGLYFITVISTTIWLEILILLGFPILFILFFSVGLRMDKLAEIYYTLLFDQSKI